MMKHTGLLLLCITLLLQACATSKKGTPDWINGNSAEYPNSRFLIGRGEHKRQAIAQDRARADLAKIFQVAVNEQSRDIVKYSSKTVGKTTISELQSEASRDISTRTEQIVEGIEIAELWQHPKTKLHHALAVIDRLRASSRLRQSISEQDEVTREHLAAAQNSKDMITKIGAASRAVQLQIERDSNQRILKIINVSGVGVPSSHNLGKLINDRDSLIKRLHIKVKASADDLGDSERIVSGAVAKAGFSHSKSNKANYLLDVQTKMQPLEDKQGWFWLRGTVDINLLDANTQENRGSHRWDIKVSGQTHASAKKRAKSEIDRLLKEKLKSTIISFGTPD